jgi:hypothetical protein
MLWHESSAGRDYSIQMRTSLVTAAELLDSIEQDIVDSRHLIHARNSDEATMALMVSSLKEDNEILKVTHVMGVQQRK